MFIQLTFTEKVNDDFFFRLVCLHFCGVGKHGVSAGARVEAAATLRSRGRHNRFTSNYRAFPREVKKAELLTQENKCKLF